MTTALVQVNFRMPAELKDKLEASAKEAGRSTTAEIVARLEDSLNAPSPRAVTASLARLEFQLHRMEVDIQRKTLEAGRLGTYLLAIEPTLNMNAMPPDVPCPAEEIIRTARQAADDLKEFMEDGAGDLPNVTRRAALSAVRTFRLTKPGEPLPRAILELLKMADIDPDTELS